MKKLGLNQFIKENEGLLVVLGLFITILPLSFDTINQLNADYAGLIAIATSIAILLILKIFLWNRKKELSIEAEIFVWVLTVISLVVSFLTYQMYTKLTLSLLDLVLSAFYFITGILLFAKFITKIEKIKKFKFLMNLIIFLIALALIYFKNADILLNDCLRRLNFVIPPILTLEYESIFFAGIYVLTLVYGLFALGIGYFCQELLYEKFLKKYILKIKLYFKKK